MKDQVKDQSKSVQYQKATKWEVFLYSFGGIGSNIPFILMMTYLNFFYTDVMGISALVVSGVMLVTRIFDAVTDPLMGILADRTKTKMGRYRPWIIFGAPLLGLLTFLVFFTPGGLGDQAKVVYVYITYILYSTFSDFANIPYHSLTPVISQDPNQRNIIVSAKNAMAIVAQLYVSFLGLQIVKAFGDGTTGWAAFGAISGILLTVAFWLCAASAKKYDVVQPKAADEPKKKEDNVKFSTQMKLIFGNGPLLALLVSFFITMIGLATSTAANMYYFKYIVGNMDLVVTTALITLVTSIISIPLMPPLAKLMGKRNLYIVTAVLGIVPVILLWVNPAASAAVIMVVFALNSFFSRFPSNLGWSMLPECVDYSEWKYGVRGNSMVTSALTFINKTGMALGGFLASFIMGIVGYSANVEPTKQVADVIVFLRFGLPVICGVISVIAIIFYTIDNKKYAQIRKEMEERKATASEAQEQ